MNMTENQIAVKVIGAKIREDIGDVIWRLFQTLPYKSICIKKQSMYLDVVMAAPTRLNEDNIIGALKDYTI